MPVLIEYLLKLSVSLVLVYFFYQLFLRRLTFYTWNRWYLLGYSALAFLMPFFNITPVLERNAWSGNRVVSLIPSLQTYTVNAEQLATCPEPIGFTNMDKWDWTLLIMATGTVIFFLRLLVNYLSLLKIRRNAKLVSDGDMKIYQVDKDIIPFSFGKSIFINQQLHSGKELEDIIRHEFVHVRQRHSIDIIWGELLCMLNWYNPAAWMIRKAIRQNLEFIADNKVVQSGIDKKQYQYLLLKVVGNNHFSIANQFNFSSLKTRIAMMNKIRSAKIHLLKFSFLLPLLTILLLAFRNGVSDKLNIVAASHDKMKMAGLVVDAGTNDPIPFARLQCKEKGVDVVADAKGYYQFEMLSDGKPLWFVVDISKEGYQPTRSTENWGISAGSTIEFFGLVKTGMKGEAFGDISTEKPGLTYPHVLDAFNKWKSLQLQYKMEREEKERVDTLPGRTAEWKPVPTPSELDFMRRHPNIKTISWGYMLSATNNNTREIEEPTRRFGEPGNMFMTITFKNGKWDMYNTSKEADVKRFKKNYGELPPDAPAAPASAKTLAPSISNQGYSIGIEDNDGNCMVVVKDKSNKELDRVLLTDWNKKQSFYENKYDAIPELLKAENVNPVSMETGDHLKFTADSILWVSETGTLQLIGNASLESQGSETFLSSDSIELHQNIPLLYIDGKEVESAKNYTGRKGGKYEVKTLGKEDAVKKYGSRGQNGALEIKSL